MAKGRKRQNPPPRCSHEAQNEILSAFLIRLFVMVFVGGEVRPTKQERTHGGMERLGAGGITRGTPLPPI